MKSLAQLDQLNLDADTKQQVTGIVQALLDQAEQAQKEIRAQAFKIEALTMELAHLRRIRFGKKNESLSAVQLSLFEESVLADIAAVDTEIKQIDPAAKTAPEKPPRSRAGRQPLPDHLPRIEHRYEPKSCQCGQCGNTLVKIGEDITEQLDVEPARFFVQRHIRPQYACKTCETITAEPVPPAVIDGGMAAPGLLASAVFVFLTSLDEFTGTFFIGLPFISTLPMLLYSSSGYNLQFASVIAIVLLIPSILFMIIIERFLKGEHFGGIGV